MRSSAEIFPLCFANLSSEGLFNTVVTGPGRIVIQTMPMSKTAGVISEYIPKQTS